jgi:photosystem II stability/assembly factor-like uncharacterized protein
MTILATAVALAATVGACGHEPHAAGADIAAIQAVGTRVAVAVGDGVILRTDDAGRSWQRDWTGAEALTAVDMLSSDVGWATSDRGVLHTTDGHTWQAISTVPVSSIHFVDGATGYGVRSTSLVRTTDGGASWSPTPAPIRPLAATADDARSLWIADAASLWHSNDAGATWARVVGGLPPPAHFVVAVDYGVVSLQAAGGDGVWAELSVGEGAAYQQPWALYGGNDGHGVRCLEAFDASAVCPDSRIDSTYPPVVSALGASRLEIAAVCPACTTPAPVGLITLPTPTPLLSGRAPVIWPISMSFGTPAVGYLVARFSTGSTESTGTDVITETRDGGRTWRVAAPIGPGST